jgi:hypothetical protein
MITKLSTWDGTSKADISVGKMDLAAKDYVPYQLCTGYVMVQLSAESVSLPFQLFLPHFQEWAISPAWG